MADPRTALSGCDLDLNVVGGADCVANGGKGKPSHYMGTIAFTTEGDTMGLWSGEWMGACDDWRMSCSRTSSSPRSRIVEALLPSSGALSHLQTVG